MRIGSGFFFAAFVLLPIVLFIGYIIVRTRFTASGRAEVRLILEVVGVVAVCVVLPLLGVIGLGRLTEGVVDPRDLFVWGFGGQGVLWALIGLGLRQARCEPETPLVDLVEQVVVGLGLGLASAAGTALIGLAFHPGGLDPSRHVELVRLASMEGTRFAVIAAVGVLVAPVGEELLFRGYVFTRLSQGAGRLPAYLVSAVLFAAAHGHLLAFPLYLVPGVVLAFAYDFKRSLTTATVAHALHNAALLAAVFLF